MLGVVCVCARPSVEIENEKSWRAVGCIREQAGAPTHRPIAGPFVSYTHHQLSFSSPRSVMSTAPSPSTSQSNFASIFNASLELYKRKTKNDLASHPLLPSLQTCKSPEAVLTVLRDQVPVFSQSQNGDDRLTKWVAPTVNVLYSFTETIGQGVGLVNIKTFRRGFSNLIFYLQAFPPASVIFAGMFFFRSVSYISPLCDLF